ncbi:related to membrane s, contain hemolysin III domain [Lecanosticta acicola]|uniref:Related to membrane s, contain hemolysin III domain n=1 Tax=Lecanosticta acicola TaxID=111012 RepID=A0AAI8YVJ1_9PEZI|nr:related to membrane s, contain hemolysin III domain [Lecanosticta acicola]
MDDREEKSASHSRETSNLIQKTEAKAKEALTVLWHDLPTWMQDNHYIQSGYRQPSNSYSKSAASIGYLHNESVNIWTHLIGAVLAGIAANVLFLAAKPRFQMATSEDVMVFSCFFAGAVGCLAMSATYHTISNHSEAVARFGNRLDYIGIIFLEWGSFIPSIYYGFASDPGLVKVYWSMITTIGAGTLVVIMHPMFRSPAWRPFRAFMFVAMGLSAVVPVLHGLQMYGYRRLEQQIGLTWLVSQGALYILGAVLYAARVPERFSPGSFDIWGSSHQIFHVLVVLAAASHLVGLMKAFDYEHSLRTSASSSSFNSWYLFGGRQD